MAGTISLSLSQQFDELGEPLSDGRLYFYRAGTVATPQNAYYDADLTLPFPNPYTLDSAGRIPQFFLADGSIKVVLIDRSGVTQINADNILVIGPSGGGGGGGSVDPTTVWQTGDVKKRYATGAHSGWVRMNGRTIGSATSGATERANTDCQALFLHLYAEDANLSVSGGRGASAAADWSANKTITLPDGKGRLIAGLDDMGATAAGRLTSTYFGATATTLGATGGSESHTLTAGQIPSITSANAAQSITVGEFGAAWQVPVTQASTISSAPAPTTGGVNVPYSGNSDWKASELNAINSISVTSNNTGGNPHNNVPPTILMTFYMKL